MLSLTINSIRANKARAVLTGIAVLLGVAFMAGTFVVTDTVQKSYDDISANVYRSTDAVVRSARVTDSADVGAKTRGTISASALATVRGATGVQTAEPQQDGIAVVVGHDGALLDTNRNRSVPVAFAWQDTPALNPMDLVSGHAPRAPDEIVIDKASAEKGRFAPGETVHVISQAGSREYHIAGVATYAGADNAAGAQVIAFTPATASEVIGTPGRYSAIEVIAAPGVSQDELVANLRTALHDSDVEVITGAQASAEAAEATGPSLQFVNMFLMTFALVALVVGSFVIYNTFSITVAQRSKENALLRALGASRRQVMRAVRLEALLTGVVASAAGIVVGIGLAQGLRSVLSAFGAELPPGGTVVEPRTVMVSMLTGVVVTLVAAWLPARRAAKVAPIEALRTTALDTSAHSKRRVVFGVLIGMAGAMFMAQGLSGAGAGPVGPGALLVFLGVAMLGPVIARRFARIVGWPLPRLRGMAGTLARENAMRNPRRTAATSSALMISLGLVAFITVFAASAKASMSTSVDRAMKSDWIVMTQFGMGGLTPSVTEHIDALPETGAVTSLRYFDAKVDGATTSASAVDPTHVEQSVGLDVRSGSVAALGAHEVAVQAETAKRKNLHVGDTVTMFFPETGDQPLTVAAVYGTKEPLGDYVISLQTFDANIAMHVDSAVVVSSAPGVSKTQAHDAVARVLQDYPTAELMTKSEFKGSMASEIDKILNLVYVLLAMALVIALLGVASTLALSVFERRREFGLLRAVGMSRAQVRSTVRWESVLVALLGTSLGTVIGLGFGWALVHALESVGFNTFRVPVQELGVIVVFAAMAAVAAAAVPARRAAKLDVLDAISNE
ncbi:MAG TPA: FtsX-like permease family protein [Acidimicrobiales bacterium]|jgi:putative ABC transport system permease protein|nr:FtsX-like permease family protein [Acidimicrobiales bacterium]